MYNMENFKLFLQNYNPADSIEETERHSFIQFLQAFGDKAYNRNNLPGHLTASSWIVNNTRQKVLMAYHKLYKSWAWTGGHADNNSDLLSVAFSEAVEETSISGLRALFPYPIDLNVMYVDKHYKNGNFVPCHLHFNVVYAFEADENTQIKPKLDENSAVQWINNEDIDKYCASDKAALFYYQRIMQKIKKIS